MAARTCSWCREPATGEIADRWRTVRSKKNGGSGSVSIGGPGTYYLVCGACAERLTERYLKAKVK